MSARKNTAAPGPWRGPGGPWQPTGPRKTLALWRGPGGPWAPARRLNGMLYV